MIVALHLVTLEQSRWESGTFCFMQNLGAQPPQLFYKSHPLANETIPGVAPITSRWRLAMAFWNRPWVCVAKALVPLIIRDIP